MGRLEHGHGVLFQQPFAYKAFFTGRLRPYGEGRSLSTPVLLWLGFGMGAAYGIDVRALQGGIDGCGSSGRLSSTSLSGVLLILDGCVNAWVWEGRLVNAWMMLLLDDQVAWGCDSIHRR